MLRFLMVLAVAGTIMAGAFASAAALGVNGGAIQAGVDATLYCDADGVTVAGWGLETDTDSVNGVRINGISTLCSGNDMFVKVFNSSGTVIGQNNVTVTAVEHAFTFAPVNPANIVKIQVWIEGPAGVTP